MYNILVLGSGGREHALCWKINQSNQCQDLFVAPGNGGTAEIAQNITLDISDFDAIQKFIVDNGIDIVVVGPELPLVNGIYDHLATNENLIIIGPSKEASQLEGSKAYANAFMEEYQIPTAGSKNITLENLDEGLNYLENKQAPYVLKADGLAAGKGVLILDNLDQAKTELEAMLKGKFGNASTTVVIEDFLDGIEFSVFVLTDGKSYILMPEAKDYKRIGEGDKGLNTGGMGAISPVPFVDDTLMDKVKTQIIEPTINGLQDRNLNYNGFVFFGLINVGGEPKVIEYNCRLGDPETEVILPRIKNDIVDLFLATGKGTLSSQEIEFIDETVATVMLVSGGYPEAYEKNKSISIPSIDTMSVVFHAGTKMDSRILKTNGGRVIAISSFGKDHNDAVQQSLEIAEQIKFEGKYYRTDIGFDL